MSALKSSACHDPSSKGASSEAALPTASDSRTLPFHLRAALARLPRKDSRLIIRICQKRAFSTARCTASSTPLLEVPVISMILYTWSMIAPLSRVMSIEFLASSGGVSRRRRHLELMERIASIISTENLVSVRCRTQGRLVYGTAQMRGPACPTLFPATKRARHGRNRP